MESSYDLDRVNVSLLGPYGVDPISTYRPPSDSAIYLTPAGRDDDPGEGPVLTDLQDVARQWLRQRQLSARPLVILVTLPKGDETMKHDFLTDELDLTAVRLLYSKWKGEDVDPAQLKLGLDNLISYGIHLTPNSVFAQQGDPAPTFGGMNESEVEQAFETILAPQNTMEAGGIGAGLFVKIILPIAIKILSGLLLG